MPRNRAVTVLVALAVASSGLLLLVRAFRDVERAASAEASGRREPQNGMIAFTGAGPQGYATSLVDPQGGSPALLTSSPEVGADLGPVWSPDGTRLAFSGYLDIYPELSGANYDVYVVNADGTGRLNLTTDEEDIGRAASQHGPAWSPDGTTIAFLDDGGRGNEQGDVDIYSMKPDGSELIQLTDTPEPEGPVAWSPDGTRIAFQCWRYDLCVMNPDGTGRVNLTDDEAHDGVPAWAPDGGEIAFVSDRGGNKGIHAVGPDGTGLRLIADLQGSEVDPVWSSDGSMIAVQVWRKGTWDVAVVGADGAVLLDRVTADRDESSPTWSPDGAFIAFFASRKSSGDNSGTYDVYVMRADGSGERRLTRESGGLGAGLSWQPVFG